ncbi:rRNA pseudouridine synthase [bacterium]|jgi:23S rRNA pseudouridine2605 synthase|nr:rRNA pseudouridine synthase [bacterium]MBT4649117.1 rRNA pseudouridine synthase [bacterium]
MTERLAKFLANHGIASRRKAEELILAGQIKVNNKIITEVATKVSAEDEIKFDNKIVGDVEKVYYLLNKPVDYICSVSDPYNDQNVLALVPKTPAVYPVGRLDKNSQGLLLLTNDGDLTYQLTHPKFKVAKKYLVRVDKVLDNNIIKKLKTGIKLEEGLAKADQAKIKNKFELEITLHQGWKRQIRRMLAELNLKVIQLTRLSEGKLSIEDLPLGKYKKINKSDII